MILDLVQLLYATSEFTPLIATSAQYEQMILMVLYIELKII